MNPGWKIRAEREAARQAVCAEYAELLRRATTKEEMVAIYKRGVDWALENKVPSYQLLCDECADLGDYGLFVDKEFKGEVLTELPVYIFHHCSGEIHVGLNVDKAIIPMLYFANGCDMRVSGIESVSPIKVPVYIFGENKVLTETSDNIQCTIYLKEVK